MSSYEGNYGEREALDELDRTAYERDTWIEERDHLEEARLDRLRRDWPVERKPA